MRHYAPQARLVLVKSQQQMLEEIAKHPAAETGVMLPDDWAGGVAFDSMSADGIPQDAKIWEQAVRKLRGGMMPPPGHKRPDHAAIKNLVSYLETTLDDASAHPDPGRVPLRRLNRREYANAVHDLIGLDVDGAAWLPQAQA